MAEDVDPNLIRQTKEALSKHIKKPPLHEKFLKKPPFRFLQDIVKSITKETKFLDGKFSDDDFDTAKDRDSKVKFLDRLIAEIETATGKKPAARPAKIVAGLDVNKTLELLILLGQAVDKNSNSKSRRPSSDKIQEEKKPAKAAEKDQRKDEDKKAASKTSEPASKDSVRKTADRPQSAKGRSRTVLKTNQPTENKDRRKSTAGQKPQSKKEEERRSSPTKKKLEKVSSRAKDEPSQVDSKKGESEQKDAIITEDAKTKNKNVDGQIELVASNERENKTKNDTLDQNDKDTQESTENQDKNLATTEKTAKKQEQESKKPVDSTKETKKTMDGVKETKKTVDSVKEHKKPADTLKEAKKPADNTKTATKSSELAKETLNKAPEKPKIPSTFDKVSDSGRVTSAIGQRTEVNQKSDMSLIKDPRPMKRVFTPEKSAKQRDETEKPVNIFTESQDGKDDADEMFMPETQYIAPMSNHTAENKGDFKEQGQLVSQIIDTKKQLESKDSDTKTNIQWEESAGWRRSSGEKEVGGVKTLIQQLTKNAGPLGQLLAGLQEDLDEMMQELTQWRQINAQLALETKKEKELTNELVKPLMKQLEELQQVEYPQENERVKAARMAVYSNDKKIEELLRSRTK